ncbi:zinc ribbon domain-containing protein [Streptomyces sp. NPDC002138]|uniref:zinc ribbon domain-containing protein n=1 Tax=Streptomyces sp. NPDC002138 TaxID=3154410 RepID=UPI003325F4BD
MRACPVCGASNGAGDDFCGNCGAYLGWSDGAASRAPAPAPEPVDSRPPADEESDPPGPSGAEPSPPEPAATRTPPPEARPAGGEDPTARGTREAERTPPPPRAAAPPATPEAPPAAPPATPRAAAPRAAAPQAATAPVDFPQAVRPAKAVAPRPVVRPAAGSDDMTGVPCPACGTPNPPDRRFCRRCAARLTPTTAPAPLPWWRTIWPFRRRTRAGSGRMVRLMVILAVVLALCAAGFLMLPAGRHLIEDTRDKLGKARAVTPTRVEASAELPGHPVSATTDGLSNRYWGAPGPGARVTYTFAKPFRLVDVIITNGASSSPEEYAKQGRALQIDMEVTARDGQKVRKRLTLSDKPGPQEFSTGISDAMTIRLTLDAPAGSAPDHHVALAEVEFFQRS